MINFIYSIIWFLFSFCSLKSWFLIQVKDGAFLGSRFVYNILFLPLPMDVLYVLIVDIKDNLKIKY